MIMKATYMVEYTIKGDPDLRSSLIKAFSAGEAFAECLKEDRDRRIVRAVREGRYKSGFGRTEFLPPPGYT